MGNTLYPLSKEDKILRNKIEVVVIGGYVVGLALSIITKMPICMLVTGLSVPISFKLFK